MKSNLIFIGKKNRIAAMKGQGKRRVYTLVKKLQSNLEVSSLLTKLETSFSPVKKSFPTAEVFCDWLIKNYYKLEQNKPELQALINNFNSLVATCEGILNGRIISKKLFVALASYDLFNKIPKEYEYIGISHKIVGPVNDDFYSEAVISVLPGTTKQELHDFIDDFYGEISSTNSVIDNEEYSLGNSSELLKRSRAKSDNIKLRDNLIIKLGRTLPPKQISAKLIEKEFTPPSTNYISQLISRSKKKRP